MTQINNTCCFTGNRPYKMPLLANENNVMHARLRDVLENEIYGMALCGVKTFYTGCALGFDLLAGEMILDQKTKNPEDKVKLICVIPYHGHEKRWETKDKERLARLIQGADEIIYVNEGYSSDCYQARNKYMVDHSDIVIACWNGERRGGTYGTLKYANRKERELHIIKPMQQEYLLVAPQWFETRLSIIPGEGDLNGKWEYYLLRVRETISKSLNEENNEILKYGSIENNDTKKMVRFLEWLQRIEELERAECRIEAKKTLTFSKESARLYELESQINALQEAAATIVAQSLDNGESLSSERLLRLCSKLHALLEQRNTLLELLISIPE